MNSRGVKLMPEPAKEHNDNKVDGSACPSNPIASEWNIKVVAQKSRKRNVPAPPEIRKANRRVGKAEIVFKMKTKTKCGTDRAGRVTSEIKKDLAGESHANGIRSQKRTRMSLSRSRRRGALKSRRLCRNVQRSGGVILDRAGSRNWR